MRKVLYLSHATPEVYSIIRDAVPAGFELMTLEQNSEEERRRKIAGCEVVIVAATPLRKPMIEAATRLELVHHQGVGWQDTIDHEALRARGIPLALTPEGTTVGVAEHTVLLVLAVLKLLPFADSELRQGRFHVNALRPMSRELAGMTMGYIGMGRIATAVSERLRAFGTTGVFFDPNVTAADGLHRLPFEQVLQEADVVTLHVPLTTQTRHMIGAAQLARMKRGAYLVNASRGGLVDEAALVSALQSGHLAGAALDVFETEPMPPGHPLSRLTNVVLTPHIAAGTRDALTAKMRALFANLVRFYRGEPLNNRVL
jgi:phosphoglycerate dehydrogenase-like enzyme